MAVKYFLQTRYLDEKVKLTIDAILQKREDQAATACILADDRMIR